MFSAPASTLMVREQVCKDAGVINSYFLYEITNQQAVRCAAGLFVQGWVQWLRLTARLAGCNELPRCRSAAEL